MKIGVSIVSRSTSLTKLKNVNTDLMKVIEIKNSNFKTLNQIIDFIDRNESISFVPLRFLLSNILMYYFLVQIFRVCRPNKTTMGISANPIICITQYLLIQLDRVLMISITRTGQAKSEFVSGNKAPELGFLFFNYVFLVFFVKKTGTLFLISDLLTSK